MDVFPSIDSSNNVLVKLVAAFNKVSETVDTASHVVEDLRKLELPEDIEDILENQKFDLIAMNVFMAIGTPVFIITVILGLYCLMCIAIRDFFINKEENKEEYKKLEENRETEIADIKKQMKEAGSRRKVTVFLSLELWMLLLLCLVIQLHTQRSESWGANTGSVQLFIGHGTDNLRTIQQRLVLTMRQVNQEMYEARDMLTEAAEDLSKYDGEIQDIILSKIDTVTEKGDRMTESAATLSLYIDECWVKNLTLIISLVYFITYITSVWAVLHRLSRKFTSCLAMFAVNMLGHILMFVLMITAYVFLMTPFLRFLHPEAGVAVNILDF